MPQAEGSNISRFGPLVEVFKHADCADYRTTISVAEQRSADNASQTARCVILQTFTLAVFLSLRRASRPECGGGGSGGGGGVLPPPPPGMGAGGVTASGDWQCQQ